MIDALLNIAVFAVLVLIIVGSGWTGRTSEFVDAYERAARPHDGQARCDRPRGARSRPKTCPVLITNAGLALTKTASIYLTNKARS